MTNAAVKVCRWISRTRGVCRRRDAIGVALGLILLLTSSSEAQTFTVLHQFSGGTDGENPQAGVVRDAAGNLYGTTLLGGSSDNCLFIGPGCGAVFKIDANGDETVLHSFTGDPDDGAYPFAGLILGEDGSLYGTTFGGGGSNNGTVFRLSNSGQAGILFAFGVSDGANPFGGVIMGKNGTLYGTTQEGGAGDSCWSGCGTVFKLYKAGNETVLFSFAPPATYPTAGMTMDTTGNLYGTTSGDGGGLGTVFMLKKNRTVPARTLYTFGGGAGGQTPHGGVVRDARGRLYGMTYLGGDVNNCIYSDGYGCGVLYELDPDGKETVLHTFTGPPDGALPYADLLRDEAGNLYGTTTFGGAFGYGTVFKLDKHRKMTILHSFANTDGATPYSTLIQDDVGNLYGTTFYGGNFTCGPQYGCGVVFKITP